MLATGGANVVINHKHTADPAGKVADGIEAPGGTAAAVVADVTAGPEYRP